MGECTGQIVVLMVEAELHCQVRGLLIQIGILVSRRPESITVPLVGLNRERQIIQHGHFVEHRGNLERTRYAGTGPVINRYVRNITTFKKYAATIGR